MNTESLEKAIMTAATFISFVIWVSSACHSHSTSSSIDRIENRLNRIEQAIRNK